MNNYDAHAPLLLYKPSCLPLLISRSRIPAFNVFNTFDTVLCKDWVFAQRSGRAKPKIYSTLERIYSQFLGFMQNKYKKGLSMKESPLESIYFLVIHSGLENPLNCSSIAFSNSAD
jgi:hypothetical protein